MPVIDRRLKPPMTSSNRSHGARVMIPGDIYNPQVVDDFFKENKSLLPIGTSAANSEVVVDDVSNNTVNLVIFRSCPKT